MQMHSNTRILQLLFELHWGKLGQFFFIGVKKIGLSADQLNPVPGRGGEVPDAVLPAGVVVGVVGAEHLPNRGGELVLAAALFAVVAILVQGEPVVARALVRPDAVLADVLTPSVIAGALVLIWKGRVLGDGGVGLDHG